jgi:hypothetical protein
MAASCGTPGGFHVAAGANNSYGSLGAAKAGAGSFQGGFHTFASAPTGGRTDFLSNDSLENDVEDLEGSSDGDGDPKNVRFAYHGSTWSKNHQTYNLEPMAFEEECIGLTGVYTKFPSYIHLFEQF